MATISTIVETVLVDGVGEVIVTPIVPDGDGAFVREIRLVDQASPIANPIFILRMRAPTADLLDLTTPALTY